MQNYYEMSLNFCVGEGLSKKLQKKVFWACSQQNINK
jgi:hypothetical protein